MNKSLKKILCGFVSISMLLSSSSLIGVSALGASDDGLLMEISFDEAGTGSGSFTPTVGSAVTEHGSVSYEDSVDAESGKALKIGSNSAENYLELPKGLLNGAEAATFSFWVKPTSGWAFMTTPKEGSQDYLNEKYLGVLATSSSFKAESYNNSGARPADLYAYGTYTDWKYVTVVFTSAGTKVYINGSLAVSDNTAVDVKSLMTADSETWIGHGNWGSGEGFSGMIDDFKVYGKALKESEIKALAQKAIDRDNAELVNEKNCLDVSTQFYSKSGITENGNDVTVDTSFVADDTYTLIGIAYDNDVISNVVTKSKIPSSEKSFTIENLKKNSTDTVKLFVRTSTDGIREIIGDKVFQYSSSENITVRTSVTNYLPASHTVELKVVPSGSSEAVYTDTRSLATMGSTEFSAEFPTDANVSSYSVILTDVTDESNPVQYDAGTLPRASVSFPGASPADSASTTEGAHDPTIFTDPVSGHYFAYSTHNLVFESEDLINWTKHDYTSVITVPDSARKFIENNYADTEVNGTYWAPDILYKEGDEYPYWFYLSTSCGLGGRNSVISLVKAKSPLLWGGETLDCGPVIVSKEEDGYNTNAIDANIYTDTDGKTYIVWGSFWKGIHTAELDDSTGLVKGLDYSSDEALLTSCKNFGTRLFSTPSGVQGPEGPWMTYNSDTGFRYLVTSYGWLGTNYNIRIARTDKTMSDVLSGKDPHRQFLDQKNRCVGATFTEQVKDGGSLDELWGYKMLGSYQLGDGITYLGNGHCSFLENNGEWYLVEHCRKVADAVAYLQVRKMLWTEDGWPVVSPLVYAGEDEQVIPKELLYGTWDLSSVGQTIFADGISDVSRSNSTKNVDLPVLSSQVVLQPDGKLGNDIGTWSYDGDHTVTLKFTVDGDNDNYEFYKSGDTMKLFVLTGYDKDERENAIVMTGTDQDGITQLAKKNNQVSQCTKLVNRVDTTAVEIAKSSGGNPVLGFDADGNTLYAGDPAALVDGDTVYIYAGHDTSTASNYVMPEWVCYSSKDMKNWKYESVIMKASDISWRVNDTTAWASQVIKHNGKYYLYYCTTNKDADKYHSIGVAVSNSPTGPFTDIGKALVDGKELTPENSSEWNDIDPTVWVETVDGVEHRYLAWGNTEFYVCELNDDMISIKDTNGDKKITAADIKHQTFNNLDGHVFTEAPWIYRQQDENGNYYGKYYLFGAFDWREQMGYATTDDLSDGQWDFGGIIMTPTATSNTNHPAVIDFKGKTYFIYHNGSLPWGSGFRRSVCVEEFTINEDGTIDLIPETSTGLTGTSVTISSGNNTLYYDNTANPSGDSDYPLKKEIFAGSVSDTGSDKWEIVQGKSDSENKSYVSIQAVNKPGLYITLNGGSDIILTQQDTNSASLARKMTFKTVKGINGESGTVSFESVSKSGYFLTVSGNTLTLTDGVDTDACSFTIE